MRTKRAAEALAQGRRRPAIGAPDPRAARSGGAEPMTLFQRHRERRLTLRRRCGGTPATEGRALWRLRMARTSASPSSSSPTGAATAGASAGFSLLTASPAAAWQGSPADRRPDGGRGSEAVSTAPPRSHQAGRPVPVAAAGPGAAPANDLRASQRVEWRHRAAMPPSAWASCCRGLATSAGCGPAVPKVVFVSGRGRCWLVLAGWGQL